MSFSVSQSLSDAFDNTAYTCNLIKEARQHPVGDAAITFACKANNARCARSAIGHLEALKHILEAKEGLNAQNPVDRELLQLRTVSQITASQDYAKNLLSAVNVLALAKHVSFPSHLTGITALLGIAKVSIDVACATLELGTNLARPTLTPEKRKWLVKKAQKRAKTRPVASETFQNAVTGEKKSHVLDKALQSVSAPTSGRWWWKVTASACRITHAGLSFAGLYSEDPDVQAMATASGKVAIACLVVDICHVVNDRRGQILDLGKRLVASLPYPDVKQGIHDGLSIM